MVPFIPTVPKLKSFDTNIEMAVLSRYQTVSLLRFINRGGKTMKYGYARVSTIQQDLESQLRTLKNEGCEVIYSEKFTGTKA